MLTLESSLHMSFNVILIFLIWISVFVSSPKMSRHDGKNWVFLSIGINTWLSTHTAVCITELHWNLSSTKPALCLQAWLCPMQHFTSPWSCTNIPIFSFPDLGREARSVRASRVEESGSTQKANCNRLKAKLGPKHRVFLLRLGSCFALKMWTRTGRNRYYKEKNQKKDCL